MAAYNGEKYIESQIESILNQDYSDWKMYISDDCSTDGTMDVIDKYCRLYPDKIYNLHNTKRFGNARDNFFYLFNSVDADIYFFSDQDDVWLPNKISAYMAFYNDLPQFEKDNPLLIHSDLEIVDSAMETINSSYYKYQSLDWRKNKINSLLYTNIVAGCTMMINRKLRDSFVVNEFANDDAIKIIMHDWWFAMIASVFGSIKYIDAPFVKYRQHENNVMGVQKKQNIIKLILKLLRKNTIHENMQKLHEQICVFGKIYARHFSPEIYKMFTRFTELNRCSKIKRCFFLLDYKIWIGNGLIDTMALFVKILFYL